MHYSGLRCTHQFDCVQSILQTRAYSVRLESFVPRAQIRMIFSIWNEYIWYSTRVHENNSQSNTQVRVAKWSSRLQMQVKHWSTDAGRVQEYRCHVKYMSTDASRIQEYRPQPSTWVQMPCQLSCEHKCARGGSHPAATLHHTVKIQCSLERNHWVRNFVPRSYCQVLLQGKNFIFLKVF